MLQGHRRMRDGKKKDHTGGGAPEKEERVL